MEVATELLVSSPSKLTDSRAEQKAGWVWHLPAQVGGTSLKGASGAIVDGTVSKRTASAIKCPSIKATVASWRPVSFFLFAAR
jgi:hypothetical protein